jgi:hypothetical protein
MTVSLTKVFSAKPGWYRGDFHAHTTCSDGVLSPRGLSDLAVEHGLDFLSITDHNDVRAFGHFDESFDRMILPGIEVTLREGHFNVFGFEGDPEQATQFFHNIVDLPNEIRYNLRRDHAQLAELMGRIQEAGMITDIAHPLLWPWEWRDHDTDIAQLNCIELINDPTYRDNPAANPSARRMWSAWLNAGYRVTAVGGTDFHSQQPSDEPTRLSRLDLPVTYVYARQLSGQAILEGVRQRHVYVSMGPQMTYEAHVDGQVYQMGDDLGKTHGTVRFYAQVVGVRGAAQAMLVKGGQIAVQVPVVEGKAEIEWQLQPAGEGPGSWVRFDVIDPQDQSLAVSNPFFFGEQTPRTRSRPFGGFLGAFAKA